MMNQFTRTRTAFNVRGEDRLRWMPDGRPDTYINAAGEVAPSDTTTPTTPTTPTTQQTAVQAALQNQQTLTIGGRHVVMGFGAGVLVGGLAVWLLKR